MSAFTLRRYEPEDADAVRTLHERALRDAGGEFLVGERGDELVAMGAFQPHESDDDAIVLRRMRVASEHQRSGYGTRVLNDLEARARKRGFDRAELDTSLSQTAALAFYEHHGYERVGEEYVKQAGMTLVFYEKGL